MDVNLTLLNAYLLHSTGKKLEEALRLYFPTLLTENFLAIKGTEFNFFER